MELRKNSSPFSMQKSVAPNKDKMESAENRNLFHATVETLPSQNVSVMSF